MGVDDDDVGNDDVDNGDVEHEYVDDENENFLALQEPSHTLIIAYIFGRKTRGKNTLGILFVSVVAYLCRHARIRGGENSKNVQCVCLCVCVFRPCTCSQIYEPIFEYDTHTHTHEKRRTWFISCMRQVSSLPQAAHILAAKESK